MSFKNSSHNDFDQGFVDGSIFENPYPIYHSLRKDDPVHWSTYKQAWIVTKYEDVDFGLKDPRLSVKRDGVQLGTLSHKDQRELSRLKRFYSLWLMYQDPPNHTRLRKAVSKAFTPKAIGELLPFMAETTQELIRKVKPDGEMELLREFANPLALSVVAGTLGIPSKDYHLIENWSLSIVDFMQGRIDSLLDGAKNAHKAVEELQQYLSSLFARHQQRSENDLITQLILAEKQGLLSSEEIVATYANIVVDGHEPIANAIANGLLALIQHPDQMELLRSNLQLMNSAVEELLRFDPAFQYSVRHARESFVLRNRHIKTGQRVLLMLASANRDKEVFTNPEVLDITRKENKHRAFGFRTHFCLGATLARPTLAYVFECLLSELSGISLPEQQIERHQRLGSRGLKSLRIRWN